MTDREKVDEELWERWEAWVTDRELDTYDAELMAVAFVSFFAGVSAERDRVAGEDEHIVQWWLMD